MSQRNRKIKLHLTAELNRIMELLLLLLLLMMMVSAGGQNLMKIRAELGKDVSLNCSIRDKDIYWSVEIYSQIRAEIGRVFYPNITLYHSEDLKSKYLMLENRLVIKNFTADDSRSYFCALKKNDQKIIVDSFFPESETTTYNQTNASKTLRTTLLQTEGVVISSLGLNGLLLFIVIGLMFLHLRKRSRNEAPEPCKNQETYYEEVQLPLPRHQAIYSKVQHPY